MLTILPTVLVAAANQHQSNPIFFLILIAGAGFYFFFYRPQQRKARAARTQGKTFDVGDEVLTAGGIIGRVLDIQDDRVTLETSVGASFTVLKQYVLRTLEPTEPVVEGSVDGAEEDHESLPPPPSGTVSGKESSSSETAGSATTLDQTDGGDPAPGGLDDEETGKPDPS